MKYDFTNKVVIVTGASSGIGKSCVEQLVNQNAKVVMASRNLDKLKEIQKEINSVDLMVVQTDVSDKAQVDALVQQVMEHFKRIDILINNAGVAVKGSITTVPLDLYEQMLAVNLHGVLYGIRAVYPHMKQQGEGIIVNVSSVAGFKGFIDSGLYSSSKFAVNGLTESFQQDAIKDNIRTLLVCPGKVETEFEGNTLYRDTPYKCKRVGISADEVAKAILKGIQSKRKMIVLGRKCMPLYLLNRLSPSLTNYVLKFIY